MAKRNKSTCDVVGCDEIATHTAFDYFVRENWEKNIMETKSTGTVQHGCDEHSVSPHAINVTSWDQPYAETW